MEAAVARAELDAQIEAWIRFWNTYDLDQVDRLFLPDGRLTYFSSEKKGVLVGLDAVREHHRGFGFVPGGKSQPNRLWLEDIGVTTFDSTAVVTGIWRFQKPDGTRQRGPVTIVYAGTGGRPKIAHMNFSNYKE